MLTKFYFNEGNKNNIGLKWVEAIVREHGSNYFNSTLHRLKIMGKGVELNLYFSLARLKLCTNGLRNKIKIEQTTTKSCPFTSHNGNSTAKVFQ